MGENIIRGFLDLLDSEEITEAMQELGATSEEMQEVTEKLSNLMREANKNERESE